MERTPETQNQQKVLEGEIAKIEDKSYENKE